jgi:trimethylamine--corrinoid protein Co-methyltransferase
MKDAIRTNYQEFVGPQFRVMSDDQLQEVHWASLEVLERTGCRVYHEGAIELLKQAGAHVSDGNLVRIPGRLVEWALRVAPNRIVLCDRQGKRTLFLEGRKTYYGTGSDCVYMRDPRTGERRQATTQDLADAVRLCDALPNIDFVMSMMIPWDVPSSVSDRCQMEAMLLHTNKPVVFVPHDGAGCADAVEMAISIAGGLEALQLNPFICGYVNVAGPLRHNRESIERLMYMAERALPFIYFGPILRGVSGPMTILGSMVLANAGQLAGLVMAQLVREGAPVIRGQSMGGPVDMRSMVNLLGAPERTRGTTELAHFYGIPIFGQSGYTESKIFDEQAVMEAALTIFADALSGNHLSHDIGHMESGKTNSMELITCCDEIIGWVRRFMEPKENVTADTLALDVIDKVGPDGNYLMEEHTLAHLREDWLPVLSDRQVYENWLADGGKSMGERVRERLFRILEHHHPNVLPAEVAEDVKKIARSAAERAAESRT